MTKDIGYKIRKISPKDNSAIAAIIRDNLEKHGLDIPGTAYFDKSLDNLYEYYANSRKRGYYVLVDDADHVIGGIGFDEVIHIQNCAELQKLYLTDSVKGAGLGYILINFIEDKMIEAGYNASYLETHSNLKAAIHIYEKSGYKKTERPENVVHGTMDNFYYKKLL